MNHSWYEVWVDEGLTPPYVLLVVSKVEGTIIVFDPKTSKVAYEAGSYEDVKLWLLEDEFRRVDGRMQLDGD